MADSKELMSGEILTFDPKGGAAKEIDGKRLLVTGGTGSFGQKFIATLLNHFEPAKILVFSRDELKQSVMRQKFAELFPEKKDVLDFVLGDVRDLGRLCEVFKKLDLVIHAAALKQVPMLEYNPYEAIKTNVLGANNVILAATQCGVKKIVALSTDKAAAPVNLYGATKLCQDKLMVAANHVQQDGPQVAVVRYGNVFGSRGSVVPIFLKQRESGTLTVTDPTMTRFTITLQEGVAFVLNSLVRMRGGEIFIPKLSSYRVGDMAETMATWQDYHCQIKDIGLRAGEKMHEVMVPRDESPNTLEFPYFFIICPAGSWWDPVRAFYKQECGAQVVPEFFEYQSGTNPAFVNGKEIAELLDGYVAEKQPAKGPQKLSLLGKQVDVTRLLN